MRVPRASTRPDSDLSSFRSRGCRVAPIDRLIEIDTNNSPYPRKLKESRQKVWPFRAQNLRNSSRARIEREVARFYFFRDHVFPRNFSLAACRYFHITLPRRGYPRGETVIGKADLTPNLVSVRSDASCTLAYR